MDARSRFRPRQDPEHADVHLSDPGEIAAGLPQLLGFRPRESVVLVSLTGATGGRVGLTVRGDIPPAEHAVALAAELTRSVCTARPQAVLLAVVSEAPDGPLDLPHRPLVHELVVALSRVGLPVRIAMLVRSGRWWSYDCPQPCCAPGAGTALPGGVSALEAAVVAAGQVVEPDREDLVRRLTGPGGLARTAMIAACDQVAVEYAGRVLAMGADAVAVESWTTVTEALGHCRPGGGTARDRLGDREVARIVWGLRDRDVRDRALELATGPDAASAEVLWTECTRRAPAPLDAAPATLLAVCAWLRGDGAMANVALTRALASEPGYALARLLAQGLAACIGPAELRALIGAAAGSGDDPRRLG
ncbi:MAG: DUF4192 domain-containing protein [Blastococcus sp.]